MKKCSHPNVVQLLEVLDDTKSNKIYLVLEYLERGEIVWQAGDGVPVMTVNEARLVARDVTSGLEYLHFQGIIHRDIKPANLLRDKDGTVKISDFGVSYASSLNCPDNELELAKTAGTPAFFAPELCVSTSNGSKENLRPPPITHKIDIWAFGVTLYCMLFGKVPFIAESELQLFDVIVNDPLVFPDERLSPSSSVSSESSLQPESIPDPQMELAKDLLQHILEKDPMKRFEVIDIMQHPWMLQGMSGLGQEIFLTTTTDEQRIEVTREEVQSAVLGIAGRIKRSLSKFGTHALSFTGFRRKGTSSTASSRSNSRDFNFSPGSSLSRNSSLTRGRSASRGKPTTATAIPPTRRELHAPHHTSSNSSLSSSLSSSANNGSWPGSSNGAREGRQLMRRMRASSRASAISTDLTSEEDVIPMPSLPLELYLDHQPIELQSNSSTESRHLIDNKPITEPVVYSGGDKPYGSLESNTLPIICEPTLAELSKVTPIDLDSDSDSIDLPIICERTPTNTTGLVPIDPELACEPTAFTTGLSSIIKPVFSSSVSLSSQASSTSTNSSSSSSSDGGELTLTVGSRAGMKRMGRMSESQLGRPSVNAPSHGVSVMRSISVNESTASHSGSTNTSQATTASNSQTSMKGGRHVVKTHPAPPLLAMPVVTRARSRSVAIGEMQLNRDHFGLGLTRGDAKSKETLT